MNFVYVILWIIIDENKHKKSIFVSVMCVLMAIDYNENLGFPIIWRIFGTILLDLHDSPELIIRR